MALSCSVFLVLVLGVGLINANSVNIPLVINTWNYSNANTGAWDSLMRGNDPVDAIADGISVCEFQQCGLAVGFGGDPDANGEVTLDAMLMDGNTINVGGVGALRRVKNAVRVAKHVLRNTKHSLLVGDQATDFAVAMGFPLDSLSTATSSNSYSNWLNNNCQPNFWVNVVSPNTCGPYIPWFVNESANSKRSVFDDENQYFSEGNHDTITMLAIDEHGNIAGGSSTNGLDHKIPGRVSDSPIAGAGVYADSKVGAASATGDGDKMMRFLPSFYAVEQMRNGVSPLEAAQNAIARIAAYHPGFWGALIVVDKHGNHGVACSGMPGGVFPYVISTLQHGQQVFNVKCLP